MMHGAVAAAALPQVCKGTVRRWSWDEGASALMPDGAALQLEENAVFCGAAVAPGLDGVL